MRIACLALGAAASLIFATAVGAQQPATNLTTSVDTLFAPVTRDGPGCAVGASRGGRTVLERYYGAADLEHGGAVTASSVFEVASVAKQFTAAAVLLLVQDGRLGLDHDIRRYLPEMPNYGATITIDQLLTHTSGLRDVTNIIPIYEPSYTGALSNTDVLNIAARQRGLNFRPGSDFAYSNTNYVLLATIVARVTGVSLAAFTQERLFGPLGMTSTSWRDNFRRVVPHRVIGYRRVGEGWNAVMPSEHIHGSAGLLTTVTDLLRWNVALDRGTLGPLVTTRLQEPARTSDGRTLEYARGLYVGEHRGAPEVYHAGGQAGFASWLARYPSAGVSVVVLCASHEGVFVDLTGRAVADLLLGARAGDQADPDNPPSAEQIAAFAGTYIDEATGEPMSLNPDGPRLRLEGASLDLVAPTVLRRDGWGDLAFLTPDLIEIRRAGRPVSRVRRAARPVLSVADLRALAGRYASDELAATYDVVVNEGRLYLQLVSRPAYARPMTPIASDLFEGHGYYFRFSREPGRRASALQFLLPSRIRITATRVAAPPAFRVDPLPALASEPRS